MTDPTADSPFVPEELSELPIFPLPNSALFPGAGLSLHVFEPRYRQLVRDSLANRRCLAIARLRPGFEAEYHGRPPIFEICGAGRIVAHTRLLDGRYDIELLGVERVCIEAELPPTRSYRVVKAVPLSDMPTNPSIIFALKQNLRSLWNALAPHLPASLRNPDEIAGISAPAGLFVDRLAAAIAHEVSLSQALIEELDPAERFHVLARHISTLLESVAPAARDNPPLN